MVAIKQFPDRTSLKRSLHIHSQLSAAYVLKLEACVRDDSAPHYAAAYVYSPRDSACVAMLRCGSPKRAYTSVCVGDHSIFV